MLLAVAADIPSATQFRPSLALLSMFTQTNCSPWSLWLPPSSFCHSLPLNARVKKFTCSVNFTWRGLSLTEIPSVDDVKKLLVGSSVHAMSFTDCGTCVSTLCCRFRICALMAVMSLPVAIWSFSLNFLVSWLPMQYADQFHLGMRCLSLSLICDSNCLVTSSCCRNVLARIISFCGSFWPSRFIVGRARSALIRSVMFYLPNFASMKHFASESLRADMINGSFFVCGTSQAKSDICLSRQTTQSYALLHFVIVLYPSGGWFPSMKATRLQSGGISTTSLKSVPISLLMSVSNVSAGNLTWSSRSCFPGSCFWVYEPRSASSSSLLNIKINCG